MAIESVMGSFERWHSGEFGAKPGQDILCIEFDDQAVSTSITDRPDSRYAGGAFRE